ncbi:type VII secretion protein EssB/YukC [Oceanobacillus zhaokaii]|nr:type VII secretion protein EssB/YukC [Oceanobacillus zhaokaii]
MIEKAQLQYGEIIDNEEVIIYEIAKEQTNLVDIEQLDELKRKDDFFFECQHILADESSIRLYYKRNKASQKLKHYRNTNKEVMRQIALQILSVDRLIGTQYTTLIHPDNIYVTADGDVKFVFRGIRSIFNQERFNTEQLLIDQKRVLLFLFSTYAYDEITGKDLNHLITTDPFLTSIINANSVMTLSSLFKKMETVPKQAAVKPTSIKQKKKENTKAPKKNVSLLSGILIGVIIGLLSMYVFKVLPLTEASTTMANENVESVKNEEQLAEKNEVLQTSLADQEKVVEAYRELMAGNTREAITLFESVEALDDNTKQTLTEQYIAQNSVESLAKAAEIGSVEQQKVIVRKLNALNTKEANQAILSINSDVPEVKIEQAWVNKEYDAIIEIFTKIADDPRAKVLAANSYIQLNRPKEAKALAYDLNDKRLQLASLNKEKELANSNKKLNEEQLTQALQKIDDEINKINE